MRTKSIFAMVGISALLVLGIACSNGEAAETPQTQAPAASDPVDVEPAVPATNEVGAAKANFEAASAASQLAASANGTGRAGQPAALLQVGSSQAGIWVTGESTITLEPDLAFVNIGVETEARTVTEARNLAANAMDAIVAAVKARGLTDTDIQTRSFNIFPRYEYSERARELVGYAVSNTATIKVRTIDDVGPIIDDVANAGGDATRINGISFTVDDTKPFMAQLREDAVRDALVKADQFASLTGVSVGRLVFIAEIGSGAPEVRDFVAMESAALRAAPAPTSISGGEMELRVRVQAAFAIQ